MPKTIALKYPGKCADCGAALPVGAPAKYYGRGKVYGTECHPKPEGLERKGSYTPRRNGTAAPDDSGKRSNGACEDAPCCGCCGPGTGGPGDYYPQEEPEPFDWEY